MTTRLIESCFDLEEQEEKAYRYFLVVDPYMINIEDLKDIKPGKIVRLRKPAWGELETYTNIYLKWRCNYAL